MPNGVLPVLREPNGNLIGESTDIALKLALLVKTTNPNFCSEKQQRLYKMSQTRPLGLCNPLLNWFSKEDSRAKLDDYLEIAIPEFKKLQIELGNQNFFSGEEEPGYGEFGIFHLADVIQSLKSGIFKDFTKFTKLIVGLYIYSVRSFSSTKPAQLSNI